jgi:hypothetical protein
VAQTVWNHRFGLSPSHGIEDLDIVYFEPEDLSRQGEADTARRLAQRLDGISLPLDVKNQARVHLWYRSRFGTEILPVESLEDALLRWPTTATSIAVRRVLGKPDLLAPFGLDDLLTGRVRANPRQITREIYEAKVRRWLAQWPELEVVPWPEGRPATP